MVKYSKVFVHAATDGDYGETRSHLRMRGYEVVDQREVRAFLKAHGLDNSRRSNAFANAVLMLQCDITVLHGSLDSLHGYQIVQQCRLNGLRCVMLGDLPLQPATSSEALDLHDLTTREEEPVSVGKVGKRAAERVRNVVGDAYAVWLRFEVWFAKRFGWFFTNGRKRSRQHERSQPVQYEQPSGLSITG